jgi:hypothetical protein
MNERTSRKIPVTERQFLWVQDDDKGEVTLHVGPTMVSPTAADRVVVDDGEGGFREDPTGRPQMMVEVGDNQYAVLFNPLVENEGAPNGKFRPGRNESRPVKNGTRAMIPGPTSFWLRPGQRVEVRDAHELASDQYLVVKVYGEIDKTAPYYDITARSASITRATADDDAIAAAPAPTELRRGQLIVIRGLDTQLYIPPTGLDIVPDTSVDDTGAGMSAAAAARLLAQLKNEAPQPPPPPAYPAGMLDRPAGESQAYATDDEIAREEVPVQAAPAPARRNLQQNQQFVEQAARSRHRKASTPPPASQAATGAAGPGQASFGANALQEVLSNPALKKAIEREARQARLIRRAVVLGEKEYCVIIDADGKREVKVGPARVFPGPYDQFMVQGSRQRIYDAYELLPTRALWLRVISSISRADLLAKLPRGVTLEKDNYYPGDELLLSGVSTFFFPFNEIEVLSPETGEAVVGNDHSRVFIEAIGIDQKSGIYVRDLATGEVRLVRGKQSYLVDPRKEVQITRTIPAEDWNLWVAAGEPHKRTEMPVTTPWAVSIVVPHNNAVLTTAADGQRVVEGPCVTLLGYEENLTPILLSTGTPKSDAAPLKTAFLRTAGNRVSDILYVETSDFVRIAVRVSYSVTFLREHKDKWFNHENYIQVMCDHLRSLIRSRCRIATLAAIWPQLPAIVRDTILGEKPPNGGRPGRVFAENGSAVIEVEVLSATIEDVEIAEQMQRVQTQMVSLQIGDRSAEQQLASARLRADIERQSLQLSVEARQREAAARDIERKLLHDAQMAGLRDKETVERESLTLREERESTAQKGRIERAKLDKDAELTALNRTADAQAAAQRVLSAAEVERTGALRQLEVLLIQAQSAATVAERQAVQAGLVEAMTALGDKLLLTEVAGNMNLVSLFKGKDVGTILAEVLRGTPVMPTVQALIDKYGGARPLPPGNGG